MTNIGGNTFVAIVVHLLDILNGQVPQKGFLVQRARIFLRLLVTEIRSEVFSFELTGHHKGQIHTGELPMILKCSRGGEKTVPQTQADEEREEGCHGGSFVVGGVDLG